MEVNSLQSQSDDVSGDKTSVRRLLFPAKEKRDVVHARDVLSEDERLSTKQPATRKRKAPASSGGMPSTAKRPRTREFASTVAPLVSSGSQLSCSPGGIERWMDAIIPREESDDEELISFKALKFVEKERPEPVDMLLRRLNKICQDSAKLDLADDSDRAMTIRNVRVGLVVVMAMCVHSQYRNGAMDTQLHSILDSVTTMITELQKPPGSDAVTAASKDIQARYAGKDGEPGRYSNKVIIYCLQKFVKNIRTAYVWNALPEHARDIRMKLWARELDDGSKTAEQEE